MAEVLKNMNVYRAGTFVRDDFRVADSMFAPADGIDNCFVLPGFVDVHVHLREPGFLYKESIFTGSRAAARGGYTAVCAMPNLDPVPDCLENLRVELAAIEKDAAVRVLPYGTITRGQAGTQLSDMEAMAPYVAAFSDDGKGVQDAQMMRRAMETAKSLGKLLVAHCEDNRLLHGGYIHDGPYARAHGHRGISAESEWRQIERDIDLAAATGCAYHVCHVSTARSAELIRQAKKSGVDISCETAPHYLLLDETMLREDGAFKMNPPLREAHDREAMLEAVLDGTVDMLATDHAPHAAAEKSRGLAGSAMGIVGLETAFPLLYTCLVRTKRLTFARLMELMHDTPCARFGIESDPARDYTVFDLEREYTIAPDEFLSKGRSTPFAGWTVSGRCLMTVSGGKVAWAEKNLFE